MKPATKRFTTLTALALTSVLLLGACGNNKKEATLTSSSSKVSQKVKSTKPSSKEKRRSLSKRQNLLVQKKSQKQPLEKRIHNHQPEMLLDLLNKKLPQQILVKKQLE